MGNARHAELRLMVRRDMPEVLDIERHSFEWPWEEEDFQRQLRGRNSWATIAEYEEQIVGYMVYELHKTLFNVVNFAVHPLHRREGIGRAMVDKLKGKLSMRRRHSITLKVCETNMDALLFFRAMGLNAVKVERNAYEHNNRDAYLMRYRYVSQLDEAMA